MLEYRGANSFIRGLFVDGWRLKSPNRELSSSRFGIAGFFLEPMYSGVLETEGNSWPPQGSVSGFDKGRSLHVTNYQIIRLRRHDEIILVQTADFVSPPLDVQIARIPKNLVWRRTVKLQIASIPKNLVCRLSVNLVVDGNTKTQSLSHLD